MSKSIPDCAIIGGGVMGLSIAYQLACSGRSVLLVERSELGKEASWAGAGILPPPTTSDNVPAWKRLQAISFQLHETWHAQLKAETGIDNGYHRCGGLHIARKAGEASVLAADMAELAADGVSIRRINDAEALNNLLPRVSQFGIAAAFHLPDESQIRNPRHLQALALACRQRGVQVVEGADVSDIEVTSDRVLRAKAQDAIIEAKNYVIATGAWSERLLQPLGLNLPVYPVRGQMLLYRFPQRPLTCIVNEGPRYIVPREDGHVLIGSTEEDVGFDKQTTEQGLAELSEFAESLLPSFAKGALVRSWAGLRPHAVDGFPYIGRVPHLANCYVAAGHYRAGLLTSTGTAVVISQLLDGQQPLINMDEFRLDR